MKRDFGERFSQETRQNDWRDDALNSEMNSTFNNRVAAGSAASLLLLFGGVTDADANIVLLQCDHPRVKIFVVLQPIKSIQNPLKTRFFRHLPSVLH